MGVTVIDQMLRFAVLIRISGVATGMSVSEAEKDVLHFALKLGIEARTGR